MTLKKDSVVFPSKKKNNENNKKIADELLDMTGIIPWTLDFKIIRVDQFDSQFLLPTVV